MKLFITLILLVSAAVTVYGQMAIQPQTCFHKNYVGPDYGDLEEDPDLVDNGGYLYVFVKNEGTTPDRVTNVKIRQGSTYVATADYQWTVWPLTTTPNAISTITLKGYDNPIAEGDTLTIEVELGSGTTITQPQYLCRTPSLRLANVMPNQAMNELLIYVRNDGAVNTDIAELWINGQTLLPNTGFTSLDNNYTVLPNQVKIFRYTSPTVMSALMPLAISIKSFLNVGPGIAQWSSAGIRVVRSQFTFGTWYSSSLNPDNEHQRQSLRTWQVSSLHGPGDANNMQNGRNEYFINTVTEPNFGPDGNNPDSTVGKPTVQALSTGNFIKYFSIDDEPDLNGKPVTSGVIKNNTYWNYGGPTPSYVNLAIQKKYNRWSWMSDYVGMDHYAAYSAPNAIPLTWVPVIGREGEMREAFEYTEYLKYNCEPRRMVSWCQLVATTWDYQPEPYHIDYQFWAHLMAGAKGIEWFVVRVGYPQDYPTQFAKGQDLTRMASQISSLFLYGEYYNGVTTSTNDVLSRALVGPDAMVVAAVNNKMDYDYDFGSLSYIPSLTAVPNFNIEFSVPNWIAIEDLYQVTPQGKQPIQGLQSLGNRQYRITPPSGINGDGLVYVIGKNDTQAPANVTEGLVSDIVSETSYYLSWNEPYDNVGIKGYLVKQNGVLVDTVRYPLYLVEDGPSVCNNPNFQIQAFDASGNVSGIYTIVGNPTFGTNPITASLATGNVNLPEGQDTSFTVDVTAAVNPAYIWQVSTNGGVTWQNVSNNAVYNFSNTEELEFNNVPYSYNGYQYRAIVTEVCTAFGDTTDAITLTVIDDTTSTKEEFAQMVSLYPNPVQNTLVVALSNTATSPTTITVTDLVGKLITTQTIPPGVSSTQLNTTTLSPGLYAITLQNAGYRFSSKFVKE